MDRTATWLQRYATSALAFPTGGFYPPFIGDPALELLADMRMAGRGFHTSEFGVYASGARPGDFDPNSELGLKYTSGSLAGDYSFYLLEPHMSFALGGPYILNWMWNDPPQTIFPWGIVEANDFVPKKTLIAYRNESYFLRHLQPAFQAPQVMVVFSKEHLMRDGRAFTDYLTSVMRRLVDDSVQFAVIDDTDLQRLGGSRHVLVYPDPRYASPDVLEELRRRVEAGDSLFLSGDFTQPLEAGGPRATDWFRRLAGLDWVADRHTDVASAIIPAAGAVRLEPYFGTPIARFASHGAEALANDAEGNPVLTAFSLGKGTVVYAPDATAEGLAGRWRPSWTGLPPRAYLSPQFFRTVPCLSSNAPTVGGSTRCLPPSRIVPASRPTAPGSTHRSPTRSAWVIIKSINLWARTVSAWSRFGLMGRLMPLKGRVNSEKAAQF